MKKFETPTVDVMKFDVEDILSTSSSECNPDCDCDVDLTGPCPLDNR